MIIKDIITYHHIIGFMEDCSNCNVLAIELPVLH